MTFSWTALTHLGRVRGHNEDALGVSGVGCLAGSALQRSGESGGSGLFVVSDGLGGANAGEVASRRVVELLLKGWEQAQRERLHATATERAHWLREQLQEAHTQIQAEASGKPEKQGMAATATVIWVTGRAFTFAHVGDSRLYHWRRGELQQLSEDQTAAWQAWRKGELTAEERDLHPERHVLDQVVGEAGLKLLDVQLGQGQLRGGDELLLCSDGLTDGLRDDAIAEWLTRPEPLEGRALALLEESLEASGKDNTSLILIRAEGIWNPRNWITQITSGLRRDR